MDSGLYTAYSGLKATADTLDVLANNLANVNTTGFKADETFLRMYNNAVSAEGTGPLDSAINDSTVVRGTASNFAPGALRTTGNPLDVAIEGNGFLEVQGPSGLCYTRNGSLHVNAEGQLVTSNGFPVLGEGGPIVLPEGQIAISSAGEIQVDGGAVDTLRIVDFKDKRALEKVGNSLFRNTGTEATALEAGQTTVRQGVLEQ